MVIGLATTAGRGQVPRDDYEPRTPSRVFLVLAPRVPFVFRRRAPLAVLLVCHVAVVLNSLLGPQRGRDAVLPLGRGDHRRRDVPDRAKVVVAAVAVFVGLVVAGGRPTAAGLDAGGFALQLPRCSRRCSCSGINLKNRKERIDRARGARRSALEREKEEEARRAVADERLHIARELHDVVAHSMGVIAVQASVGEHVIDDNPAEAKRALEAISGVSRSTLAEIRRMLGVLRETDDERGRVARRTHPRPASPSSTGSSASSTARGSRSRWRTTVRGWSCRAASTSPRTGSCRRRSPT